MNFVIRYFVACLLHHFQGLVFVSCRMLIFRASKGNEDRFKKIGYMEKSGVKLLCSTKEGKRLLVPVIGGFENMRV